MCVFWHRYEPIDPKPIEFARPLQSDDNRLANLVVCEMWQPVVTGEGHKMRLSGVMKAFESAWHEVQFSDKKTGVWAASSPTFAKKLADVGHL
jgi:hypothetical protein